MDAVQWNTFIQEHDGSFLQSWQWGRFQERYGHTVIRLQKDQLAIQLIVHTLPAGRTYLFSPYGPVGHANFMSGLLDLITAEATKHKAVFWRYENLHEAIGGNKAHDIHPHYTWVTPLVDSETMLANMKSKWRYNIRLAERKGVTVRVSSDVKDVRIVHELLSNTAQRQGISIHLQMYYQLMLDELGPDGMAKLYLAEHDGNVVAANLMIGFGSTMTYVHGGSNHEYRSLMAPHALQWKAMMDAYEAGYTQYDFFGIAPPDQLDHPWAGITRFKQGFGGELREYSGTYEVPLNKMWYNAYSLAKKIRSEH